MAVSEASPGSPGQPAHRRTQGRDSILRAAEQLFAEHGFDGCSLRHVADLAQVNQGMIHYFFKSKEALFTETYLRCGEPLVAQRLQRLDEAERAAGGAPVPVQRLVEIFLGPAVELALQGSSGRCFLRMQAQLQLDSRSFGAGLRSRLYDVSSRRFVAAFARSLPGLSPEQVSWRFVFVLGAYQYALADTGRIEVISDGACSGQDFGRALAHLVPFLAAGMSEGQPPPLSPPAAPRAGAARPA